MKFDFIWKLNQFLFVSFMCFIKVFNSEFKIQILKKFKLKNGFLSSNV